MHVRQHWAHGIFLPRSEAAHWPLRWKINELWLQAQITHKGKHDAHLKGDPQGANGRGGGFSS